MDMDVQVLDEQTLFFKDIFSCVTWDPSLQCINSQVVACGLRSWGAHTRGRTHIPCTARGILNHQTTREVPRLYCLEHFQVDKKLSKQYSFHVSPLPINPLSHSFQFPLLLTSCINVKHLLQLKLVTTESIWIHYYWLKSMVHIRVQAYCCIFHFLKIGFNFQGSFRFTAKLSRKYRKNSTSSLQPLPSSHAQSPPLSTAPTRVVHSCNG